MAKQIIDLGLAPNDNLGDKLRAGGAKINDNFTELYSKTFALVDTDISNTSTWTGATTKDALNTIYAAKGNWDVAYSHSLITTGNPHQLYASDLVDGAFVLKRAASLTDGQFLKWNNGTGVAETGVVYQLYQPDGTNPFVYTDNGGNFHIDGNIIQSGSSYETHAEQVYTTKDLIITRDGAVSGLGAGEYTGIQATLYDGVNNGQLVFDNNGFARVGDVGSTVRIAAIEDAPINGGYATYNDTTKIFDTKSAAQTAIDLNYWTLIDNAHINFSGGRVSVGGTDPSAELNVVGLIQASENMHIKSPTGVGALATGVFSLQDSTGATQFYLGSPTTGNSDLYLYSGAVGSIRAVTENGGIFIKNTNGFTGFLNTDPQAAVDVTGDAIIRGTLDVLGTGNSYIMGNFGIGTSSPTTKFEVVSNEVLNFAMTTTHSVAGGHSIYQCYNNGSLTQGLGIYGGLGTENDIDFWVDGKFYIKGDGNVGIGTTTPTLAKLQVDGNIYASSGITSGGVVVATGFSQSGVPILRGSQSALPASTIDFQSANNLTKTLTAALTLAFSNIATGTAITLTLTTGATLYAVNLVQSGVTFGGYSDDVISGVVQGLAINSTYDISFLALSATQIRVSVNEVTF